MLTKFDKALAALIVSFVAGILQHFFGWVVSPEIGTTLTAVLAGAFTWLVPNKS